MTSQPSPPSSAGERSWLRGANREVIRADSGSGFRWAQHGYPEPGVAKWNYHPEYELHLIRSSEGRWVIGDVVGAFNPGHVALVGPDLPHDWVSFIEPGQYLSNRDVIVQFTHDWILECAKVMPEIEQVAPRLDQSKGGLVFRGRTEANLAPLIENIGGADGLGRVIALMATLKVIAEAPDEDVVFLNARYSRPAESKRRSMSTVDVGLDYILKNLESTVSLEHAARLANMSESAFSRYFKRASGLTFTEMATKIRISHACKLLDVGKDSIASIASQVGYSNQSNFNRQFRRITGSTPREYRSSARARVSTGDGYHF